MGSESIILTPHQEQLKDIGVAYLSEKGHRTLLIEGSAGTGKTTLIAFVIKELKQALSQKGERTYSAVMTAPTNKAVEVLRSKGSLQGDIYSDYCTLHSALRLKYTIDENTGEELFEPDGKQEEKLQGATLLVIDEASMISEKLLTYVEGYLQKNPLLKVIFVGDIKQLPPVNEVTSPIFTRGYKRLELREIIRQAAENPIIPLSNNINQLNSFIDNTTANGLGYTFTKDRAKIIRHFSQHRDDLGVRYLGYTNRCVDRFNSEVRREIFHHPKRIELGETIIFDRPYETMELDDLGNKARRLYTNNEEVLIESVDVIDKDYEIPTDKNGGYKIVRFKLYWANESLPILHEESAFLYADVLDELRKKAIKRQYYWKDYYAVRHQFVAFKHRYAMTVHKAQGSTYREVFMDYDDMLLNNKLQERDKLLYTAITRASEHLTVVTSRLRDGR